MAECKELQALSTISSEVDDSNVKIILSSQCIKAQIFLADRLRKESERRKAVCKNISSANLKLEAEIKHAEMELKSMNTAYETLRSAKIELKKELLLAKESKMEILQRVETGARKYEDLWQQCKKRYESIPFVQKYFSANNDTQVLKDRINSVESEKTHILREIKSKCDVIKQKEKKIIINVAKFLCEERPKLVEALKEKTLLKKTISTEISQKMKEEEAKAVIIVTPIENTKKQANSIILDDGDWPSLHSDNFADERDTLMMPKLQFSKNYLDNLADLNKIKNDCANNKQDSTQKSESNMKEVAKDTKDDNSYVATLFKKSYLSDDRDIEENNDAKSQGFRTRKLINIIDDMTITKENALKLVSSAKPKTIQEIAPLNNDAAEIDNEDSEMEHNTLMARETEDEIIEEIDLTNRSQTIMIPPTPFMDQIKESTDDPDDEIFQRSHTGLKRKRVSFELPVIEEVPEEVNNDDDNAEGVCQDADNDVTGTSQLDASVASNESFGKMREMILKKHNLDLSPDFIYAKNKRVEENTITSKFFNKKDINKPIESENAPALDQKTGEKTKEHLESKDISSTIDKAKQMIQEKSQEVDASNADYDEVIIATPSKTPDFMRSDRPVAGLLFTHGPHGIPESLDVSISTTGFEEDDGNYAHCIDSSLLLSPKANLALPEAEEGQALQSQDVPNFLSGLRKSGFSFFGGQSTSNTNPDSSEPNKGSNFNFNFGGDGKKGRGGLFSMFQ